MAGSLKLVDLQVGLLGGLDYPAATAVADFYYFGDTRLLQNIYRSVGSDDIHDAYLWDPYLNLSEYKRMGDMLSEPEWEFQCFRYDDRNRLVDASLGNWDVPCYDPWDPSGPATPYRQTFAYDEIHNITSKVDEDGTNPPVTASYTYPTSGLGVEQPHAPTSIGGVSYTWDDAGRLTASGSDSYGWDLFGRLETATVSGTATTNVYDSAGQRVVHEIDAAGGSTPDTIVYTVGGTTELTYTAATTSTGARRYYQFAGKTVFTATDDPASAFLWDNHQGTNTIAIDSTGVHQLDYYPYGASRDTAPYPKTTRTFLGQQHDTDTGLAYLNARHYNPTTGIFLSVDLLVVATGRPYLYGNGNPATFADPSGLGPFGGPLWGCPRGECYPSDPQAAQDGLRSTGEACDANACNKTARFSFSPVPGAGHVNLNLFIEQGEVGGPFHYRGDGRSASTSAGCDVSRVCIVLDLEHGMGFVQVSYSCRASGSCFDAHDINGNVNELSVEHQVGGGFVLNLSGKHSDPGLAEKFNCCLQIDFSLEFDPRYVDIYENSSGVIYNEVSQGDSISITRENFPSVEAYAWASDGSLTDSYVYNADTSSIFPGLPAGLWPWTSHTRNLQVTPTFTIPLGPVV